MLMFRTKSEVIEFSDLVKNLPSPKLVWDSQIALPWNSGLAQARVFDEWIDVESPIAQKYSKLYSNISNGVYRSIVIGSEAANGSNFQKADLRNYSKSVSNDDLIIFLHRDLTP